MTTTSITALRRSRKDDLNKLTAAVDKLNEKAGREVDGRFWQPTRDKAGNGFAEIRFLPAPAGEDVPWARLFTHAFEGPTGLWYIENSLTSLGEPDPVSEHNRMLWATGSDANRALVSKRKRKQVYICNVLVIKDPANPDNEGKVFLYKFGQKIWGKIQSCLHPDPGTDDPINVFDFWDGANFKLKIRTVDKYPNYDMSQFGAPKALSEDDEKLEEIWKQCHSLAELVSPDKFKSYGELEKHFFQVIGEGGADRAINRSGSNPPALAEPAADDDDDAPTSMHSRSLPPRGAAAVVSASDDDDDDLAEFRRLLKG